MSDQPVHIRNAHALLQGLEKLAAEVSTLNAKVASVENRYVTLESQVRTLKALMGSGVFHTSSGSTVVPDAD
jgi:uncharacterized protein YlxW (UPF0749 family)